MIQNVKHITEHIAYDKPEEIGCRFQGDDLILYLPDGRYLSVDDAFRMVQSGKTITPEDFRTS